MRLYLREGHEFAGDEESLPVEVARAPGVGQVPDLQMLKEILQTFENIRPHATIYRAFMITRSVGFSDT